MRDDKRAMLGMPSYGEISPSASRAYWQASRTPGNVHFANREGSLLAANFNTLWCDALNLKFVDGEQLDYFAMQHSDVGPEDFWLDAMIDELEARDLDVLGAVVPIKDVRGLTSIALERPDRDPWRPLCRLSMAEVFRLPETFTSEDTGYPLLLNTGLWVCRFDPSWVKKNIHFTINDAIIYDKTIKRFIAKCEPEDWNFSRQLNKLGLKIGATRKIQLVHRGPGEVTNTAPWGYEYDNEWNDHSVIPDDGFRFPYDVEGWLTYKEGRGLFDAARGKRVLEIGSYCGRSTICLAQGAESVDSVDPHDGRGTAVPRETFTLLHDNLVRYGVGVKVEMYLCTAREFTFRPDVMRREELFDLVFIDGAHDYQSVKQDIEDAISLLAEGGLIVFHDYHSPVDPDVTTAVDELLSAGAELLSTHDSLAVVRPPALIPLEV